MAEAWGCRPDVLEAELPAVWADRWAALNQARGKAQEGPKTGAAAAACLRG